MPHNMQLITGDEFKQLENIDSDLSDALSNYETEHENLREADQRLANTGLEGSSLDRDTIGEVRNTLVDLGQAEQDLSSQNLTVPRARTARCVAPVSLPATHRSKRALLYGLTLPL